MKQGTSTLISSTLLTVLIPFFSAIAFADSYRFEGDFGAPGNWDYAKLTSACEQTLATSWFSTFDPAKESVQAANPKPQVGKGTKAVRVECLVTQSRRPASQ